MIRANRFFLASLALFLTGSRLYGSALQAVSVYASYPTAERANVSQWLYHFSTEVRSRWEWGIELDWTIPLRTDIYYGRLPAPVYVSDLVNEHGQYLGRYRTELRVDYIGVPAMLRLKLFSVGDEPRGSTSSLRDISFTVNATAGPRLDVFIPNYVAGMGDETGWTYGGPERGAPVGDFGLPVPSVHTIGLGTEVALATRLRLGRLLITPEFRVHANITNPSRSLFDPNVLVPAVVVGAGYAF